MTRPDDAIEAEDVHTRFGAQVVHRGVSFAVRRASFTALIGASGSGKSVLLREVVGLVRPAAGRVRLLGVDVWHDGAAALARIRRAVGMMFQDGALFSSLSVGENVAVPIVEHAPVPPRLLESIVALRLGQAGLPLSVASRMPSALSGGMRKRAAIARALALEPAVLLLDEPTSGLDPATARGIDALLRGLVDDLGLTVLAVTHDLDTLLGAVDCIVALTDGRVAAIGDARAMLASGDPWIHDYFAARRTVAASSMDN